jgi:parallel beta-helix repeat protein
LEVPGGEFVEAAGDSPSSLVREIDLPAKGVWYLWLQATSLSPEQSLLTYDLDGLQPLHSSRREILIQPSARQAWINYSRYPDFKIEVHAARRGKHRLRFNLLKGKVRLDKVLGTLYYSAAIQDGRLDHSGDPGGGWADFSSPAAEVDGFRPDWSPPAIRAPRGYYVDADGGDDSASGLSPQRAWRTLARANGHVFLPGQALFLKRGCRWEEPLHPRGSGSPGRWISVGAYGQGEKPYLNGGRLPGFSLKDQDYWLVQDLQGTSDPEYGQDAFFFEVSKGAPRARGLKVLNCLAFDSGRDGIEVGPYRGYDGVFLENCLSFSNGHDGIQVHGESQRDGRNVVIRFCTAYSNPGQAGIWINGCQNGLIERCTAYNNACVNIWAWNAANITIRRCEAWRGRPPQDASGFDIDWSCDACTLEYCYSHENQGDGLLLMGGGESLYKGYPLQSRYGLARYNVALGPAPCDMTETFQHGKVLHNLFIGTAEHAALYVSGWPLDPSGWGGGWASDTEFRDNLVMARPPAFPLEVDDLATRQNNLWVGNLYFRGNARSELARWGGRMKPPHFWLDGVKTWATAPSKFSGLEDLRQATGQEAAGKEGDPLLADPQAREYGRLPLEGFRLKPDSPALGQGKKDDLEDPWLGARRALLEETGAEAYGIPMEPGQAQEDYWGETLSKTASIGPER